MFAWPTFIRNHVMLVGSVLTGPRGGRAPLDRAAAADVSVSSSGAGIFSR